MARDDLLPVDGGLAREYAEERDAPAVSHVGDHVAEGLGVPGHLEADVETLAHAELALRVLDPPLADVEGERCAHLPCELQPVGVHVGDDDVTRAEEIYIGLRTQLSGSSVIGDGCTTSTGKGRAMFLESRAWNCKVIEGSGPPDMLAGPDQGCTAAEAGFIDENLPKYNILEEGEFPDDNTLIQEVSGGTTNTVVRLGEPGEDLSCAQIRAAFE